MTWPVSELPQRALSATEANGKSNNGNIDDNIAKQLDGLTATGTSSPTNQKPAAAGNDGTGDVAANGSSPGLTDKKEKEFVVFI